MDSPANRLIARLTALSTDRERLDVLRETIRSILNDAKRHDDELRAGVVSPRPLNPSLPSLDQTHAIARLFSLHERMSIEFVTEDAPKLNSLPKPISPFPCGNTRLSQPQECLNEGTIRCDGCNLVAYCSNACRSAHRVSHQRDCASALNSAQWKPDWVKGKRPPALDAPLGDEPSWESIPATDRLNLANNEGAGYNKDLNLLFTQVSGDLRSLIRTVNSIPESYTGNLKIVLNDENPATVTRNFLLLHILSSAGDIDALAELAIHVFHSPFIASDHLFHINYMLLTMGSYVNSSKPNLVDIPTASGLHLTAAFSNDEFMWLASIMAPRPPFGYTAREGYDKDMLDSSRVDILHMDYVAIKPAHRVAINHFRRAGVAAPFGYRKTRHGCPNPTLFDGTTWLQRDMCSPLHGWDLEDVLNFGPTKGAHKDDLFGCLYYYAFDQFKTFISRIRKFKITIQIFTSSAEELSQDILANELSPNGLPSTTRFDRIDVSERVDISYEKRLRPWAPLLNHDNPHSTLLCTTRVWMSNFVNDPSRISKNTDLMVKACKNPRLREVIKDLEIEEQIGIATPLALTMDESSLEFDELLRTERVPELTKELGLKMKAKNTISPHRLGVSLDAPQNSIPYRENDEDWFYSIMLREYPPSERFVEFAVASSSSG